jgi:hypothetical protein
MQALVRTQYIIVAAPLISALYQQQWPKNKKKRTILTDQSLPSKKVCSMTWLVVNDVTHESQALRTFRYSRCPVKS